MSRPIAISTLLLTAVSSHAEPYGPTLPPVARKTPVDILNAQYEGRYGPRRNGRPCRVQKGKEKGDQIVVCADASGTSSPYRLPFPDERGAPGDRVSHVSEPPGASLDFGACCAEPSRLFETIGKVVRALKGEDPH